MRNTLAVALPEHAQRPATLKLCTAPGEPTPSSRLPVLTSANDIREFVRYLNRQPSGVVPAEELDRSKRRLFEERKLSAYRNLGITEERGGSLILSPYGRALAARLEPETQAFRELLTGIHLYVAAVEWMYERNLEVVTTTDLVAFWRSLDNDIDEFHKPDSSKGAAISFFSLCEAAELGTLTLGKRGHTTRLNIDRQQLFRFVQSDSREVGSPCDLIDIT